MAQHKGDIMDDDLQQRPELRLHDRGEVLFKRIRVQTAHTDRTVNALDEAAAFREVMQVDQPRLIGEFTAFAVEGGVKSVHPTADMIAACNFTKPMRRRLVNAISKGII